MRLGRASNSSRFSLPSSPAPFNSTPVAAFRLVQQYRPGQSRRSSDCSTTTGSPDPTAKSAPSRAAARNTLADRTSHEAEAVRDRGGQGAGRRTDNQLDTTRVGDGKARAVSRTTHCSVTTASSCSASTACTSVPGPAATLPRNSRTIVSRRGLTDLMAVDTGVLSLFRVLRCNLHGIALSILFCILHSKLDEIIGT